MRHAALTLAQQTHRRAEAMPVPDLIFASDMLDLAAWKGLVGPPWANLPAVLYFHENQWTYPLSPGQTPDLHYGYTNFLSAVAAEAVWFNSQYHRQSFLSAASRILRRMPDHDHLDDLDQIAARSRCLYPGIAIRQKPPVAARALTAKAPLNIGWVSRWEHDKRPEVFVEAIERLRRRPPDQDFRLILLGETFRQMPDCYHQLHEICHPHILHSGFAASRQAYQSWLGEMDVVVSTAAHEFFGIAIAEAAAAGAAPILPEDLAYPELYGDGHGAAAFYDGSAGQLEATIRRLAADDEALRQLQQAAARRAARLDWSHQAAEFDDAAELVVGC